LEPVATGGAIYHYDGRQVFFNTYVNCIGQPHLKFEEFPFKSLIRDRTITPAKLKYQYADHGKNDLEKGLAVSQDEKGGYYLQVPGITINDDFQVVDIYGALNERIYMMAVPYIGGYNPDYSGLDFSEEASAIIIKSLSS